MSVEQGSQNGKTDAIQAAEPAERMPTFEREKLRGYFDAITLSGPGGTGKTTIGKRLEEILGTRFRKVGDFARILHRRETGEEIVGAEERPFARDLLLDRATARAIKRGKGQIIEGHLAGWEAFKQRDKVTVRIFLTTDNPDLPFSRVTERENKKIEQQRRRKIRENNTLPLEAQYAEDILELPEFLTFAKAKQQTLERQVHNTGMWVSLYPVLADIDPYDPNSGIYNLVIKTDKLEPEAVAAYIYNYLIDEGLLEEKPKAQDDTTKPTLPTSGEVFPAVQ